MTEHEIEEFYIRYHEKGYDILVVPAIQIAIDGCLKIKSKVDDSLLYEEVAEISHGNEKSERDLLWVEEYGRAFDDFNQFDEYYRALKSKSKSSD